MEVEIISKRILAVILLIQLTAFSHLAIAQTYRYGFIVGTIAVTKTKYYVNQLSDVDSSADKGTHSNFTAQQYGPDLTNDTLTEENTGSGIDTLLLYVNTCDWVLDEWNVYGFPYEEVLNAIDYDEPSPKWIETSVKNKLEGDFFFANSSKSTETIINITVQVYARNSDNSSLGVYIWDGPSYAELEDQALTPSWQWVNYSWQWVNYTATTVLDTWAKIDGAKMNVGSKANGGPYQIDCARLLVEYDSTNYEADLEVQWTNVDYDEANEELCVYGGTMGSESLRVDVWNGSSWHNVIASLTSGWNNVSISTYLVSSTFTIRFKGTTETSDATQDSWVIDATLLHVWKS